MTQEAERSRQEFWAERRVLVTGASGILGSWLVKELLAHDANVVSLVWDLDPLSELCRSGDIQRVSMVYGSLEDFHAIERALTTYEVDSVFHLGAQTIVGTARSDPLHTLEVNIRGTYNLLEACRLHSEQVSRVVVASSDKAYGRADILPYTEDMHLQGRQPYDVSKSCADLISQAYYHAYQLPVGIVRCGNIYGGGDLNWSRIVPGTIRSFSRGERPVLRSDGTYIRDYIYVKDVVRAYMRVAECLGDERIQGQAFNVSTESPMSVLEILQAIQRLMKCDHIAPDILDQGEGEIHEQYLSAAKAHALLGWVPQFDLIQGLSETIEWYNNLLS